MKQPAENELMFGKIYFALSEFVPQPLLSQVADTVKMCLVGTQFEVKKNETIKHKFD